MLTHNRVKAHECYICKKKFSMKGSLVTHFQTNLGEKPYGCAECGQWFTASSNRTRHIRTHHKELSKVQQSELKCEIPKSIVHDYLNRKILMQKLLKLRFDLLKCTLPI